MAVPLHSVESKERLVDTSARLTSKGQITIPKAVRDALELNEGDVLIFRVNGRQATVTRSPSLIELAGSFEVPAALRGMSWTEVREAARRARKP